MNQPDWSFCSSTNRSRAVRSTPCGESYSVKPLRMETQRRSQSNWGDIVDKWHRKELATLRRAFRGRSPLCSTKRHVTTTSRLNDGWCLEGKWGARGARKKCGGDRSCVSIRNGFTSESCSVKPLRMETQRRSQSNWGDGS